LRIKISQEYVVRCDQCINIETMVTALERNGGSEGYKKSASF